ncbi:MAG: cyclic nucleotide-binding domain-containing protein [Sedimentitalea sp.]|uniref:Crp/Fnr family transcriptional regulator n=1 Tax=Sedimentitalea sp. TaxID=2048915 RepID=UPI0032666839
MWLDIFLKDAPIRKIAKDTAVFRQENRVQFIYLVRSGVVALAHPMTDGVPLTLHTATANMGLAEASLFAPTYQCDAVARTDAEVATLPRTVFLNAIRICPDIALSLIESHAKDVQT